MTPAIEALDAAGVDYQLHRYETSASSGFGDEVVAALDLDPRRTLKTLVVMLDGDRPAVALVPVDSSLGLKALARAAGARTATMAPPAVAEAATGYRKGGISPLGQRRRLPTFVDDSALGHPTVFVSGGRRGLELELSPADLVAHCEATAAPLRAG